MEIVILWRTSKGIFYRYEDAIMKKNRAKIDIDYRSGNVAEGLRETPKSFYALHDGDKYFALTEINIEE